MNSTQQLSSRNILLKAGPCKTVIWKINVSLGWNWWVFLSTTDYHIISWADSRAFTVSTGNVSRHWNLMRSLFQTGKKKSKKQSKTKEVWKHLNENQLLARFCRVSGEGIFALCMTGPFQGMRKNDTLGSLRTPAKLLGEKIGSVTLHLHCCES